MNARDHDHVYEPQSAKDIPQVFDKDEGFCEAREDNLHCACWWEGEPCCGCKYDGGEKGDEQ